MVEIFHQWLEELAQLLELIDLHQVTGIEHHGLEFRPVPGYPRGRHRGLGAVGVDRVRQTVGEGVDLFRQRSASNQQSAFHGAQSARLPAFQAYR
ncbi:hypothetical protein D3C73_1482710 [compost metagenome]